MAGNEFDFIKRYFVEKANVLNSHTVLANGDDASVHMLANDEHMVVSTDTAVLGVHWPHDFPLDKAAERAVCAALSDLAAMGAKPCWAWVSVVAEHKEDLDAIGQGISTALNHYHVELAGGDTVCAKTTVLNITVAGIVQKSRAMQRNQACVGDKLWLLGDVGLSALGLAQWMNGSQSGSFTPYFTTVKPKLEQGLQLAELGVRCCIDVSDGLLQDAGHIADASGVGIKIEASTLPNWVSLVDDIGEEDAQRVLLSGGEDYALLFTAPNSLSEKLSPLASCIGECVSASGIQVLKNGQEIDVEPRGYKHFE